MSDRFPLMVLVVPPWDELWKAYRDKDLGGVGDLLKQRIASEMGAAGLDPFNATDFQVLALPSNGTVEDRAGGPADETPDLIVCQLLMTGGQRAVADLDDSVERVFGPEAAFGVDLQAGPSALEPWCPGEAPYPLFGNRTAALALMRAVPRPAMLPGPRPVNLVMMDTGIPARFLPPPPDLRGWTVVAGNVVRQPGDPLTPHGEMVLRNARALAPMVTVLDCPIIPDGITNLQMFLSSAIAAAIAVRRTIRRARRDEGTDRSAWVICNAWGVFDPSTEPPAAGRYSDNPNHPLAKEYRRLNALDVDVVFAAGNCGQFCPNPACHPSFTGPAASINGVNALAQVLTVGAVRADRVWLGYSGQGRGIAGMAREKPDLCTVSQFEDDEDGFANTGTSAACGLASGAVALLRTRWGPSTVDPGLLREKLRETAVQPDDSEDWHGHTGHGVLNVAGVVARLP